MKHNPLKKKLGPHPLLLTRVIFTLQLQVRNMSVTVSRPRTRARARALFLHTSSLSDAEYTVYVDALCDILEQPEASGGEGRQRW